MQFVLGTDAGLTPGAHYWFVIQDGSRTLVGDFQTAPVGTSRTDTVQLGNPQTLVYSTNPDLSGGTVVPAAAAQAISVPAQGVVYWKAGTGPIRVLVNP